MGRARIVGPDRARLRVISGPALAVRAKATVAIRTVRRDPALVDVPRLAVRRAPFGLVLLAAVFNLWTYRPEVTPAQNLNDGSLHLAMIQWARHMIDTGRVPLDGWFPNLGLGFAQFHHYSSLPHIISAYLSKVVGVDATYFWSLYLLWALWPISVFIGARLFGLSKWSSGWAALVAPLLVSVPNYGFEQASYTWWGLGIWAQLWGMWLLPIALGLSFRAIDGTGSYAWAALTNGLTVAFHFLTGYIALLAIGLWVIVAPFDVLRRSRRAAIVGLGAVLVACWQIVPELVDGGWTIRSVFGKGTVFSDSFGAQQVLGWLLTGQLYDATRFPVVSALVAVGLVVCVSRWRRDRTSRAIVSFWLLSLVLFFGRPSLGPFVKILPLSSDLQMNRFIMGVHMGGILLAGIGTAWLIGRLVRLAEWKLPAIRTAMVAGLAGVIALAGLTPAWTQIADREVGGTQVKLAQQAADASDGTDLQILVDWLKTFPPGRVYAGSRGGWGESYTVGYVPVYAELANRSMDVLGYRLRVASLMSDAEVLFDERNPAQYDLFNVRYLILPQSVQPSVPATLLTSQGRFSLWQVPTTGYLEVVDTIGPPIAADQGTIGSQTAPFLQSDQLARRQFPTIAFNGAPAAAPTLATASSPAGPAGSVTIEHASLQDGLVSGQVVANRTAVVILKASYDPRWQVTVDGVRVQPEMIAPALVGRTVPPGVHTITFRYVPFPGYPLMLVISVLSLFILFAWPRLRRVIQNHRIGVGRRSDRSLPRQRSATSSPNGQSSGRRGRVGIGTIE